MQDRTFAHLRNLNGRFGQVERQDATQSGSSPIGIADVQRLNCAAPTGGRTNELLDASAATEPILLDRRYSLLQHPPLYVSLFHREPRPHHQSC